MEKTIEAITFTVLITTYNRLSYLRQAVQSALRQTIPVKQIIICDDASCDGTQEYCQTLGNPIVYLRNPSNLGHAETVNLGLQYVTGTWIKFLDDDDFLHPECLWQFQQAIQQYPQSVLVSCRAYRICPNGTTISPRHASNVVEYISQKGIYLAMLLERANLGETSRVAVKTSVVQQVGGWKTEWNYAYDEIEFWIRVVEFGHVIILHRPYVYYREWGGGYCRKFPFSEMFRRNLAIKTMIHMRLSSYRRPPLVRIEHYLRIHWGLLAIRNRKIKEGFAILSFSLLSIPSCWLFFRVNIAKIFQRISWFHKD